MSIPPRGSQARVTNAQGPMSARGAMPEVRTTLPCAEPRYPGVGSRSRNSASIASIKAAGLHGFWKTAEKSSGCCSPMAACAALSNITGVEAVSGLALYGAGELKPCHYRHHEICYKKRGVRRG